MDREGHNPRQLAALCGVSQRTIAHILKCEKVPRIDTVEAIANVYGLYGWVLLTHNMVSSMHDYPRLSNLVSDYSSASAEGRRLIEQLASREAEYASSRDR